MLQVSLSLSERNDRQIFRVLKVKEVEAKYIEANNGEVNILK